MVVVSSEIPLKNHFPHREWHIVPDKNPNCFFLKTATGHIICTLRFSNIKNTGFLPLIAAAPELQDIAEMYRDSMIGNPAETSMLFEMVNEILNRITPHSV